MPTSRPVRQHGFTLLELIVGVALFGLIAIALYGSLQMGLRVSEAGTARASSLQEMRLILGFLRRELESAVPVVSISEGKSDSIFEGEREWVRFAVDRPPLRGPGGFYVVRIENEQKDGKSVIAMRWKLMHPDLDDNDDAVNQRVIAEDASVSFEFFGRERSAESASWQDKWSSETQTPTLVRISVAGPDRNWPVIVAPLRVNTARVSRSGRNLDDDDEDESEGDDNATQSDGGAPVPPDGADNAQ
ncbi:MAG: prepilin-type N-terminal cleavage/methylation domain-containing protein [Gammaproteobacteria bacterium]|nr:prepilin-type N-terminal cleavage/methylation domain-containing protein [Gammaproteobacteria bacterium]